MPCSLEQWHSTRVHARFCSSGPATVRANLHSRSRPRSKCGLPQGPLRWQVNSPFQPTPAHKWRRWPSAAKSTASFAKRPREPPSNDGRMKSGRTCVLRAAACPQSRPDTMPNRCVRESHAGLKSRPSTAGQRRRCAQPPQRATRLTRRHRSAPRRPNGVRRNQRFARTTPGRGRARGPSARRGTELCDDN